MAAKRVSKVSKLGEPTKGGSDIGAMAPSKIKDIGGFVHNNGRKEGIYG